MTSRGHGFAEVACNKKAESYYCIEWMLPFGLVFCDQCSLLLKHEILKKLGPYVSNLFIILKLFNFTRFWHS